MFIRRYATSATRARGFLATGGTIFDHDGMRVHRFTTNQTFTVRRGTAEIEVFVLGPGGYPIGNATGGAGGRLIQVTRTVSPGTYTVEIRPTPPPGAVGEPPGFTRFMGTEARHSPHLPGSTAHYVSGPNIEIWYGGGGAGPTSGGSAVGGGGGRGGHGADGTPLNLWGQQIRVGAGGGGGAQRRFGLAGQTQRGGAGGAGGGGAGGSPGSLNGGDATGWGNGGGSPGGNLIGELNEEIGTPGAPTSGFVVIRYPLELLEGP